ncbi:MAG: RNA 2',3'-cyclic phosphodiesterase [bacterium]
MRCYLAIVLPKSLIKEIFDYCQEFEFGPNFRPAKAKLSHITFEFFSDLPEDLYKKIAIQLEAELSLIREFEIVLGEYDTFPNRIHSKILIRKVIRSKPIYALKNIIDSVKDNYLLPTNRRKFTPHITIGRWSEPYHLEKSILNNMNNLRKTPKFVAKEMNFIKSNLTQAGTVHSKLNQFAFENED